MAHKLYRNTDNFKRGTYSYANKMNGREEGVRGKGKSWGGGGEERGEERGGRGGGRGGGEEMGRDGLTVFSSSKNCSK